MKCLLLFWEIENIISNYIFTVLLMCCLVPPPGLQCLYCDSDEDKCTEFSIAGTSIKSCPISNDNQCDIYKRLYPNGTTAQIKRGCSTETSCKYPDWTIRGEKHCKMCCKSNGCNNNTRVDPCNQFSNARHLIPVVISALIPICVLIRFGTKIGA